MKVSVVICTYGLDRIDNLRDAVESISDQAYNDFEILLVADNDKKLLTQLSEVFNQSDVKLVVSDQKGLSNARNLGVKHSLGDIVAFLDDDAIAEKEWLSQIAKNYLNDSNVLGVGGLIRSSWEGQRPNWFPEELDWIVGCTYAGHPEERCEVRNIIGCNMSFRKEVFDRIGLFNSSIGRVGRKLLAGEEMELCTRISSTYPNGRIIYDPSIVVYHKVHKHRQSFSYMLKRSYNEGLSKSMISMLKRNDTSENVLSTENSYSKYIMCVSLPKRVKGIFKTGKASKNSAVQIAALVFAMTSVVLGYAVGRIAFRKAIR
jgi:glycosyltransferase involved in cell wall biosynthesis